MTDYEKQLNHLGKKTDYIYEYNPDILEAFENKHPNDGGWVRLICSEFTALCPMTGQPDFATMFINYIPGAQMVESKSLKLYLTGFRNHGGFHEDVTNVICKDLNKLMKPKYIEVYGAFHPRGGIAIYPFAQQYNQEDPYWQEMARRRMEAIPVDNSHFRLSPH